MFHLCHFNFFIKYSTHIKVVSVRFLFFPNCFSAVLRYVHACEVASVVSDSCDPMDCSPPGSSVHEILQTRIQ